jgi:hypothetical protein
VSADPTTEVPLIWTTKGNLPIASLQQFVQWELTDDYVKFREVHKTADGEIVRDATHIYKRKGVDLSAVAELPAAPV